MTQSALSITLDFVTAETAFAAYQLACTTGTPDAWQAAAHALASGLRAERARRMAPRPGNSRPRLVIDNTTTAPEPKAKAARRAKAATVDLDAPVSVPKRAAAVGSFIVFWSDGSTTRVQGVTWSNSKPAGRWARAYQAANRVRRIRLSRALVRDLSGPDGSPPAGRWRSGPCGVPIDTPDWQALVKTYPLAHLTTVHDESTGETFSAPTGSTFGSGDAAAARDIEARVTLPALPGSWADAARTGTKLERRDGAITYRLDREDGPTCGQMTPWTPAWRQQMIHDARAAFTRALVFGLEPAPAADGPAGVPA